MKNFITIFTPSYNRAETLGRLYKSLIEQTNKNFEWVIVDDGSTDNTENIVNSWINEDNGFNIIYFKKKNGGKHTAINKGLELARGKMFFIVDSDDYIVKDAIEKIIKYEKNIVKNENEKFGGIAFSKGYNENKIIGTTFIGEYIDATSLERKKYNINGDKSEIFYTDILKQNKFPEFEGEKFVTEALVWNRIARQGYKLRWFQDIICICEYREDGLTKKGSNIFKDSPKGLLLYLNEYIEDYKLNALRRLLKYEYYSNSIYNNKNILKASKDLKIKPITLIIGIFLRKIVRIFHLNSNIKNTKKTQEKQ